MCLWLFIIIIMESGVKWWNINKVLERIKNVKAFENSEFTGNVCCVLCWKCRKRYVFPVLPV